MALIKCPECYHQISDEARTCPYCGYPINDSFNKETEKKENEKRNLHALLIIAVLALVISIGVIVGIKGKERSNGRVSTNKKTTATATEIQLTTLPPLYYDIFETYATRINNNSYSYKVVLAELYQTGYIVEDHYSMSHSIKVMDENGCFSSIVFNPNKSGVLTISTVDFCGPDLFPIASVDDGVHMLEIKYKVLYGYNMYVDSLSTLELYSKQILLQQ